MSYGKEHCSGFLVLGERSGVKLFVDVKSGNKRATRDLLSIRATWSTGSLSGLKLNY